MAAQGVRLSKSEQLELRKAERMFNEKLIDLDKAENCGIDCQDMRAGIHQYLESISALLREFGTHSATE